MNPFQHKGKDFEIAYSKYADMLYRLAFSYMTHREDAEDIVQDVFTKYMCGFHLPMDEEHEKAWFVRVTINQCHDALRSRSYRNHSSLEEMVEVGADESIEDSIENRMEDSSLQELLKLLPEKYRGVVILHYLEGYSVEEVAKIMGISVSATKMRLKRSRDFLKQELEQKS